MPFPLLDPVTFQRIGTNSFPLSEWLNPLNNPNFLPTSIERWPKVLVGDMMDFVKAITTPESRDDIVKWVVMNHFGEDMPETELFVGAIYDALPDNLKHLIWFTSYSYNSEERGYGPKYTVYFRYLTNIDGSYTDSSTAYCQLAYKREENGTITVKPSHLTDLVSLANDPAYTAYFAAQSYRARLINSSDRFVPGTIRQMLGYTIGAHGFQDRGGNGTPRSLYSAQMLQALLADGASISIETSHVLGDYIMFKHMPSNTNRAPIEKILSYSSNVLEYLPYSVKGLTEQKATLYGVELEACSDYTPKEVIGSQKDLFFILKQDGSITGNKREKYEMVTVPCSMKAHKRLWAEFFEKTDYTKFDTTKNTGNGMHVHVDRTAFTDAHLNRFIWFLTSPSNESFVYAISERPTKANLQQWAAMPSYTRQKTKVLASKMATAVNAGLRGAVHLKGTKTVEVRVFKGIVSYATVIKNLEFVDSVVEFTKVTSLQQTSLQSYLKWLQATPKNRYQTLKVFLSEVNVAEMTFTAEMHDFVWGIDDDQVIYGKLLKATFEVTNKHITFLNKRRRKRVFILKNGKVIFLNSNCGLLSKHDKVIQASQTRGSSSFTLTPFGA